MTTPRPIHHRIATALLFAVAFPAVLGANPPTTTTAPASQQAHPKLTAAIVDFEATIPGTPDLGKQIGEALTAMLSGDRAFDLVERSALARSLQEQQLALTGLMNNEQAIKVGKLVGARVMITGKAFALGDHFLMTAKLIGTETSLVEGVLVRAKVGADTSGMVVELAEKIAARLRESGPKLTADQDAGKDPLPDLKAKLAKLQRPVVAVVITEHHVAQLDAHLDPAAETEIKLLLTQAGITVKDVAANKLTDWLKDTDKIKGGQWPQELSNVDLIVSGDGVSETGAHIGGLISCTARVEINLIQRKDGHILLADKEVTRGVDLSDTIAAKKALEKAGNALGLKILNYLSANLPPAKPE